MDAADDGTIVELGAALRKRREELGMKQIALAARLGIDSGHLSSVELGKRRPSAALVRRACRALNISDEETSRLLGLLSVSLLKRQGFPPSAETTIGDIRADAEAPLEVFMAIPFLGKVDCGGFVWRLTGDEDRGQWEFRQIPPDHYRDRCFMLEASGDSMAPEIREGDELLFEPGREPVDGDIVVAQLTEGGEGATVKVFERHGGAVLLKPHNPAYDSMVLVSVGDGSGLFRFNDDTVGLDIKGVLYRFNRSF